MNETTLGSAGRLGWRFGALSEMGRGVGRNEAPGGGGAGEVAKKKKKKTERGRCRHRPCATRDKEVCKIAASPDAA